MINPISYIIFGFVGFRFSHIDQENVELQKNEWEKWANIHYESVVKKTVEESDSEKSESSETELEKSTKKETYNTKGKLIFVYQSPDMKYLYQKCAPHLVLLDVTYKITKYAPPLFFAVVKANVNFQVVGVLVFQEETKDMIKKGLQITLDWNPTVIPEFGMIDFDEKEISTLEELFRDIEVFICSFHCEQAWIRWTNKSEHGVSYITDDIKCCLRRMAHASSREELDKSIKDFLSREHFTGKLKVWFTKKWLPEIKRWAVYFRPNQLMLTNTNNGTESLNRELKTEDI